jgi:hypothetical protein
MRKYNSYREIMVLLEHCADALPILKNLTEDLRTFALSRQETAASFATRHAELSLECKTEENKLLQKTMQHMEWRRTVQDLHDQLGIMQKKYPGVIPKRTKPTHGLTSTSKTEDDLSFTYYMRPEKHKPPLAISWATLSEAPPPRLSGIDTPPPQPRQARAMRLPSSGLLL